eukprot:1348362-Heterocapsa_arctica.AAC.1
MYSETASCQNAAICGHQIPKERFTTVLLHPVSTAAFAATECFTNSYHLLQSIYAATTQGPLSLDSSLLAATSQTKA